MHDPDANRAALALLLVMVAWAVIVLWFNPSGWAVAAVLALLAVVTAPPLP